MKKINKMKSWFFEKMHKIDKLFRLKKKRKAQTANKRGIIKEGYHGRFYCH